MPLQKCEIGGKPGWRYGQSGTCYTFKKGDAASEKAAKKKAVKQAVAIGGGKAPKDLSDRELAAAGIAVSREMTKWCRVCEKVKPEAKFREDGRTSDGIATTCEDCRSAGRTMAEHETVDIDAVELLATGGPYFGSGSPPEGDYFEVDFLAEIAQAYGELRDEIRIPVKVGHNHAQTLLANSGLAGLSDDERPAAGWVENVRVEGEKLLGDLKKVPKKLAELMKLDSFRTRSVELSRVTSQTLAGKEFPTVLTGLALLGAKAPAVRTLDDILAWYAETTGATALSAGRLLAADEADATVARTIDYSAGDVIWDDEDGCNDWMGDLSIALNGGREGEYGPDGAWMPPRFWVRDVDQINRRALVGDRELDYDALWVVPLTVDGSGDPVPADEAEWTLATSAWIEANTGAGDESDATAMLSDVERLVRSGEWRAAADRLLAAVDDPANGADTRGMETPLQHFDDEQISAFAETLGIEETDAAARRSAVAAAFAGEETTTPPTPAPPTPPVPPAPAPTPGEPPAATEDADQAQLLADAQLGRRAFEERRTERREANLSVALSQGRIDPESLDGPSGWRAFFDANEELAMSQLLAQPINMARVAVFGQDDTGSLEAAQAAGDQHYAAFAGALGIRPISIGGNQ